MKTCDRCGSIVNGFYNCKNRDDGLEHICKVCRKKQNTEWVSKNPEKVSATYKRYYDKNYQRIKDKKRKSNQEWNNRNKEKMSAYYKKYQSEHRAARNAAYAKRETIKLNATPWWSDLTAIKEKYIEADRLTRETKIKHQVDHIVPLQSKTVCGLHVPWNLQILTAEENNKKHTKYDSRVLELSI